MKKLLFFILFSGSFTLFAQNIELIGGINYNSFYDIEEVTPHSSSSYKPENRYTMRLGVENIKIDWITFRFTLSYDKYGGKIKGSDGGLGGGSSTAAEIDKSVISLGIFPVNFKILNNIDLNLGVELGRLVSENFKGRERGWLMNKPDYNKDLNEVYDYFSAKGYFGIRGRIAYDFNISDDWAISPQYSYYLGLLLNEFDQFPINTKSMRHYFSLGIQKKLK